MQSIAPSKLISCKLSQKFRRETKIDLDKVIGRTLVLDLSSGVLRITSKSLFLTNYGVMLGNSLHFLHPQNLDL